MKKTLIALFCIVTAIVFTQCGNDRVILLTNIEKNDATLTDEIPAHSGRFSSKIDSVNIYSFTIERELKDIPAERIKKISIKAWVQMPVIDESVIFVIEIRNNEKTVLYNGKKITDFVHEINKWTKISYQVDIPDKISSTSFMKAYLWTANKKVAYVDDLEVMIQ